MGLPLYEGLAGELRQQIISGQLRPNDRLPSERTLLDHYAVGRQTIRAALELLEREGRIVARQGRGWFVRDGVPLRWHIQRSELHDRRGDQTPADVWADDVRDQGRKPEESIEVAVRAAGGRVGELLAVDAESMVIARRRSRYVDGELYMLDSTYFPRDLVRGTPIEEPGDVQPGTWAILEGLGHGWTEPPTDILNGRPASTAEADQFGIIVGAPMWERWRIRRTATGAPVAVTETVAPCERVTIVLGAE